MDFNEDRRAALYASVASGVLFGLGMAAWVWIW